MTKLLIATPSDCFANALSNTLDDVWDIHVCTDGYASIEIMKYLQPEAMVLNLNMPQIDGLKILEESFPDVPPATLALSPMVNDYIAQACMSLGVKYLMPLPCAVDEIAHRLEDIYSALREPPSAIARHLEVLGFRFTQDGTKYLETALRIFSEQPDLRLHKEIYPQIVQLCDAGNEVCVEMAIRHAIDSAWRHGKVSVWMKYFPANPKGLVSRPTIKEFLTAVAQKL